MPLGQVPPLLLEELGGPGFARSSQHDRELSTSDVGSRAGYIPHSGDGLAREVKTDARMLAKELSEPPDSCPLKALVVLLLHEQAKPQGILEVEGFALPGRLACEIQPSAIERPL